MIKCLVTGNSFGIEDKLGIIIFVVINLIDFFIFLNNFLQEKGNRGENEIMWKRKRIGIS